MRSSLQVAMSPDVLHVCWLSLVCLHDRVKPFERRSVSHGLHWLQVRSPCCSSLWERYSLRSHLISAGQSSLCVPVDLRLVVRVYAKHQYTVIQCNCCCAAIPQILPVAQFNNISVPAGGVQSAARHVLDAAFHTTYNSLPRSGEAFA
jgi:hypothetical protein